VRFESPWQRMGPVNDAELQLMVGGAAQLHIPVAVVVHFKPQQRDIKIPALAQTVGTDVGQDARERHADTHISDEVRKIELPTRTSRQ
jgi:hypothetical protein